MLTIKGIRIIWPKCLLIYLHCLLINHLHFIYISLVYRECMSARVCSKGCWNNLAQVSSHAPALFVDEPPLLHYISSVNRECMPASAYSQGCWNTLPWESSLANIMLAWSTLVPCHIFLVWREFVLLCIWLDEIAEPSSHLYQWARLVINISVFYKVMLSRALGLKLWRAKPFNLWHGVTTC